MLAFFLNDATLRASVYALGTPLCMGVRAAAAFVLTTHTIRALMFFAIYQVGVVVWGAIYSGVAKSGTVLVEAGSDIVMCRCRVWLVKTIFSLIFFSGNQARGL